MTFKHWKKLIEIGNEVEFTYKGRRFSLTYPDSNSKQEQGIYFGEFYKDHKRFETADHFMNNATIDDTLLNDIWKDVTDIDVF